MKKYHLTFLALLSLPILWTNTLFAQFADQETQELTITQVYNENGESLVVSYPCCDQTNNAAPPSDQWGFPRDTEDTIILLPRPGLLYYQAQINFGLNQAFNIKMLNKSFSIEYNNTHVKEGLFIFIDGDEQTGRWDRLYFNDADQHVYSVNRTDSSRQVEDVFEALRARLFTYHSETQWEALLEGRGLWEVVAPDLSPCEEKIVALIRSLEFTASIEPIHAINPWESVTSQDLINEILDAIYQAQIDFRTECPQF
jgi:hypothetical protein